MKLMSLCKNICCTALLFSLFIAGFSPATKAADGAIARNINTFIDTLGVNTHMVHGWLGGSYANMIRNEWDLAYLGLHYVRDCFCDDYSTNRLLKLNADLGIKFDALVSPINYPNGLAAIQAYPGVMAEVEGMNEADIFATDLLTGLSQAAALQKKIYPYVKSNPATADIRVDSPTVIKAGSPEKIGNISGYTDRVSSHVYPQWNGLKAEFPMHDIQVITGLMAPMAPGKPKVITEGGWWTKPYATGVTEDIQARYTLNFLLDSYIAGISRTYLYELSDEYPDPFGTSREYHFGMFRADGTIKPAAFALHNMTSLLTDTSNLPWPAWLDYRVDNMPDTARQLLLVRADSVFVLILWDDVSLWDNTRLKPRATQKTQVMVNLGVPASTVHIYDPLVGTKPTQKERNVSGFTVTLSDHPIMLFIKPSAYHKASAGP